MTRDLAVGTSDTLVEKYASHDAWRRARRIVRDAWRSDPVAMTPARRRHSPTLLRRKPPEAYGGFDAVVLAARAVEAGLFVVDHAPQGAAVHAFNARWSPAAFLARLKEAASDLRELRILEALGCADALAFAHGNVFLNEGINELWNLFCGAAGTAYSNANAQIGVGDSTTAAVATQTDLQAATNKLFKAMDASYPTSGTSQVATFKSTFGSSEGNFAWQEWSVRNGASADKNINRKVESLGTKVSGAVWTLTTSLSIA